MKHPALIGTGQTEFAVGNLYNFHFFAGLKCVGHSFAYVEHFVFSRDVWIRMQRAAIGSMRANNLVTLRWVNIITVYNSRIYF